MIKFYNIYYEWNNTKMKHLMCMYESSLSEEVKGILDDTWVKKGISFQVRDSKGKLIYRTN